MKTIQKEQEHKRFSIFKMNSNIIKNLRLNYARYLKNLIQIQEIWIDKYLVYKVIAKFWSKKINKKDLKYQT